MSSQNFARLKDVVSRPIRWDQGSIDTPNPSTLILRHGAAVLFTGAAAGLTILLSPVLETFIFALFFAAVALSAWYGGRGPGILASLLSIFGLQLFFVGPPLTLELPDAAGWVRLGVVLFVALLIAGLSDSLRRSRGQARAAAERVTRLQHATAALASALTGREIVEITIERAMTAVDATAAGLAVLNEDGTALEVVHAVNWPDEVLERFRRTPLSRESHLSESITEGRTVIVAGDDDDVRYPEAEKIQRALGVAASAVVPLRLRGRTVGALGLAFREPRELGDEEREFMEALAQPCAQALERARLYEAVRASAEEQRRLYEEARKAVTARDEVLAFVSHDLRNSLVAVLMSVRQLLRSGVDTERANSLLGRIAAAAEQMDRLIGDLLTVSKPEADRLELRMEEVDGRAVVRESCDLTATVVESRGLSLRTEVGADLPAARADRGRLMDVLQNLLGNAAKFTPEGGQIVVRLDRDGDLLRFEVADTGEGITGEDLPHVFDRFWHSRRSGHAGVGLGLAICKGIVEAHGGRIWAESEPGAGSRFFFTIPTVDGRGVTHDPQAAEASTPG